MITTRNLSQNFRILKKDNYRIYFGGQLVSLTGYWMQIVAQSWLVYRLSHSAIWLGIVTFCSQFPAFLMSPVAGVVADRFPRRKVILVVLALELLQALALAALVFSGRIQLWQITVLAAGLGVVNAFDMTTRHSFSVDLVGKGDLSAAIRLNSVLMNGSRILGPALAGPTLKLVGEAWCFLINGLSCIPVAVGLARMELAEQIEPRASETNLLGHLVEGMRYALRSHLIFRLLVLSTAVCLVASSFVVLLPVFAKSVLGGGAEVLAWLTSVMGIGAVAGSVTQSGAPSSRAALKRTLARALVFWGLGMAIIGLSRNLAISLAGMFMVGYFMMSFFPTLNDALQRDVHDHMRGRVMSFYTMTFLGTAPFGGLLLGWFADRAGAPATAVGTGVATAALGLALLARELIRRAS